MKGLLTSLITVLTFTGLQAQSLPTAPKLVVGLTIDQLRTDYLEAFSSLYGERGFKRLWKEGRVFHNAEYTFSGVDRASAMAAIYSESTTFRQRDHFQPMDGCSHPTPCQQYGRRGLHGLLHRPDLRPYQIINLYHCRRTENSDTRQRYRIRHRPFLRRSHSSLPDMQETERSGSIPRPENGAERLIMANSPGGQANITTVRPSTPASPASHGNRFSHVVCTLSCQIGGT